MGAITRYFRFHAASLLSIALRGVALILGFGVTYYIGHQMGPEANGNYALIAQTALLLSGVAVGGLDLAIVRDFSAAVAHGKKPSLQSFLRICLCSLILVAAVMGVIGLAGGKLFAGLSAANAPQAAMLLLAILFFTRTITRITSAFLRSQRAYIQSQVIEVLLIPGVAVLAIILRFAPSLDAVLHWTAIGGIVAAAAGVALSLRHTARGPEAHRVPTRAMLKTALPLWGVAVSRDFAEWYGLAIVAALLSVYDAGLYRVAMQVALTLLVITVSLFGVFAPKISVAYAKRDYAQIARLTRSGTRLATLLVVPLAFAIFIFAEPILGLIGAEFRAGTLLLQIVIVSYAAVVCLGPTGLTLALSGHERVNLALTLCSLAILLMAVPLAATLGGLIWVGIAIGAVTVGRNIISLIAVRKLLGITILTGRYTPTPAQLRAAEERART